jgi:hypothetical protein
MGLPSIERRLPRPFAVPRQHGRRLHRPDRPDQPRLAHACGQPARAGQHGRQPVRPIADRLGLQGDDHLRAAPVDLPPIELMRLAAVAQHDRARRGGRIQAEVSQGFDVRLAGRDRPIGRHHPRPAPHGPLVNMTCRPVDQRDLRRLPECEHAAGADRRGARGPHAGPAGEGILDVDRGRGGRRVGGGPAVETRMVAPAFAAVGQGQQVGNGADDDRSHAGHVSGGTIDAMPPNLSRKRVVAQVRRRELDGPAGRPPDARPGRAAGGK